MDENESFSALMQELRSGQHQAANAVFCRYAEQLVSLRVVIWTNDLQTKWIRRMLFSPRTAAFLFVIATGGWMSRIGKACGGC